MVCIVTGASQGIGREIAIKMANKGYMVVINYKSNDELANETLNIIKENNNEAILYKADMSNHDEVKTMMKYVYTKFGSIDCLINNAGLANDELLLTLHDNKVDEAINLNIKGVLYASKEASRYMSKKKNGVIINISSISSIKATLGQSVYSLTKGAINSLTSELAVELSAFNIRVNAILPGLIETKMIERIPNEYKEMYLKNIPLKSFGKPSDVANAVAFLASDDAKYITGAKLVIDGGLSL